MLDHDLHAKRVDSLCDATLGVLRSASLAVCTIGQGLAAARGLNPKHATKQVDRLLSNPMINVDDILVRWVPYVVGARNAIVVALDWTDFDADKQATIMLSVITDHGRATPLVWLTVDKCTLKNNRSLYEHRVLVRLAELLPPDVKVCVVADRESRGGSPTCPIRRVCPMGTGSRRIRSSTGGAAALQGQLKVSSNQCKAEPIGPARSPWPPLMLLFVIFQERYRSIEPIAKSQF